MEGKKKKVWAGAGVSVGRRLVEVGDPGQSGKKECGAPGMSWNV